MLDVTRWNPRSETATPLDLIDRWLNRNASSGWPYFGTEELSSGRWMPPIDIRETSESYEVTAELPGLSKDDINITLENNMLTISGERRFSKDTQEESYHRLERRYGKFHRSFGLPNRVDAANVDASFKEGILYLTIPKTEEVKPRKISIH